MEHIENKLFCWVQTNGWKIVSRFESSSCVTWYLPIFDGASQFRPVFMHNPRTHTACNRPRNAGTHLNDLNWFLDVVLIKAASTF